MTCGSAEGSGLKLPDAPRGDLVVTVLTARDDAFTVKGYDIHMSLPIALADAVLGCEAKVQSPRGRTAAFGTGLVWFG